MSIYIKKDGKTVKILKSDSEFGVMPLETFIAAELFHLHLDECETCSSNPWALCDIGHNLLFKTWEDHEPVTFKRDEYGK